MEPLTWWRVAEVTAQRLLSATEWRSQLADAVRRAAEAEYVTVVTCPPQQYLSAQAGTSPESHQKLTEDLFVRFLPRIERTSEGMTGGLTTDEVYAPLDRTADSEMTLELKRTLFTPNNIHSLLHVFLTSADGRPIGWISVGLGCPSDQAMKRFAGPLKGVAEHASETLRGAIALAEACGIVPAMPQEEALNHLSARERQIVRLVMLGLSDANVAERLELSETTIGSHMKKIFRRLKVHSRVELAARFGSTGRETVVTGAEDLVQGLRPDTKE
jgi:DNA-binding CsgD family transcriptional regulator